MLSEIISFEANMEFIDDVSEFLRRSGRYIDNGYVLESFGCTDENILFATLGTSKKSVMGFGLDKEEQKDNNGKT